VKLGNSDGSEEIQYMHTLKLYIEFLCGWRCRLCSALFYYGI